MSMTLLGFSALGLFLGLGAYTYLGYPVALKAIATGRGGQPRGEPPENHWPLVSITVPMYNEEHQAADLVESLLALEYPEHRRQILIVSDASTDRTDEIVASYQDRGVELLRLAQRGGKTAVENAAALRLRGEIIVNTDASTRIRPDALNRLVAWLADPEVGLASGRDVSVARTGDDANVGESGYVGYEMWVRDLETSTSGIVGASGCLYAIRADLHQIPVPGYLSRDFAAALKCQEHGYRAVSVPDAICFVPRTGSIRAEYRRKVRTITRGIRTLHHWRHLLNPFRYGLFAWKLFSHKACRWALPWFAVLGVVGLALLAPEYPWARGFLLLGLAVGALGTLGWMIGDRVSLPGPLRALAFLVMGNVAAMHATVNALRGRRDAIWEPTRREETAGATRG